MGGKQQSNLNTLIFEQNVFITMIDHCTRQNPLEACGLLSGINGVAQTLIPMTNVLRSPNAFQMDIRQIEMVFQQMKERGEQLVGIYHSHPTTSPYPSPTDVIYANYPEAIYVIISLSGINPEVGCFRIYHRHVTPIRYVVKMNHVL